MRCFTHISSSVAVVFVTLLFGSPPSVARDPLCKRTDKPAETSRTHSLREKASRFAPRLTLRAWFEPSDDRKARDQVQTSALVPSPIPTPSASQHDAQVREPYGWQVSMRWDLVEMAEAVRPGLVESSARLTPTECLETQTMARRLLLEDELNEGGEDL